MISIGYKLGQSKTFLKWANVIALATLIFVSEIDLWATFFEWVNLIYINM